MGGRRAAVHWRRAPSRACFPSLLRRNGVTGKLSLPNWCSAVLARHLSLGERFCCVVRSLVCRRFWGSMKNGAGANSPGWWRPWCGRCDRLSSLPSRERSLAVQPHVRAWFTCHPASGRWPCSRSLVRSMVYFSVCWLYWTWPISSNPSYGLLFVASSQHTPLCVPGYLLGPILPLSLVLSH